MSGRKYTRAELADQVTEAIECKTAAEQVLARAESLVAALTEAAFLTESLRPAAESAREALRDITHQLADLTAAFGESRLMRLTLEEVQQKRRAVAALRDRLEALTKSCREGSASAAIRAELAALVGEIDACRAELEPWLGEAYSAFVRETKELVEQVDSEMRRDGAIGDSGQRVSSQEARFSRLRETAAEHVSMDAQRRYVAQALEAVCREMGFAVRPLALQSPLDDLVLEVDTYAYGVIHFRLQLDGIIRSQSEMVEASCGANFERIEEGLRELGVASGFRYEGDQRPVRLEKGSKSVPGSGEAAAMKRGGS